MEEYKRRFSELTDSDTQDFSSQIISNLDNTDWLTKRNIIRTLVKRIEINLQDVNVVFRVREQQESSEHEENQNY